MFFSACNNLMPASVQCTDPRLFMSCQPRCTVWSPMHFRILTYLHTYILPNSMEQSASWEAGRFTATQEIPGILWNPKVHHRTHKCPPPVLSWVKSIQSIPPHPTSWRFIQSTPPHHTSWISILILYSHLRLGLTSGLFPSGFPSTTLHTPLLSTIHATCSAHLILLDLNTRTIFDAE